MSRRAGPHLVTPVGEDLFLVHRCTGEAFRLNAAAATVFSTVAGGGSADDAVDAIVSATGADEATVRADVLATVAELESIGALQPEH